MRTDVHKPSSIVPDDYTYVAEDYIKVEDLGSTLFLKAQREVIAAHRARTGGTYAQVETSGNCQVCGSVNALYTSIFYHLPSNTYVRMGHDCADKCDMSGSFERNLFRKQIQDVREAQAGKRKAQALLGDAGLSAAWDIYVADYESLPRDPKTVRLHTLEWTTNPGGEQGPFCKQCNSFVDLKGVRCTYEYAGSLYYEERTIRDIVGKFVKYGSISENAMGLLRKLVERIPDRDKRNAEYATKRAAEKANAKPAPTGRVKVEGMVLKVEERENDFGTRTVMTVKTDDGWTAWGSVPSGIIVEKDCRVVFVATVTPSDTDDKFAFFKRPVLYKTKEEKAAEKAQRKAEEAQ